VNFSIVQRVSQIDLAYDSDECAIGVDDRNTPNLRVLHPMQQRRQIVVRHRHHQGHWRHVITHDARERVAPRDTPHGNVPGRDDPNQHGLQPVAHHWQARIHIVVHELGRVRNSIAWEDN
jgi:hypothetical protein